MGGPGSGRKPEQVCRAGLHDLNDPNNVRLIKRGNKVERECRPCQNKRQLEWWHKNRGKG